MAKLKKLTLESKLAIAGLVLTSLLGVATLFAAYHIFYLQKEIRSLKIENLERTPVLPASTIIILGDEEGGRYSMRIKITNTGSGTIKKSEYDSPIKFTFPASSEIESANIEESNPEGIRPVVTFRGNQATVAETMLNSGDSFILKVNFREFPIPGTAIPFESLLRIEGLKEIEEKKFDER